MQRATVVRLVRTGLLTALSDGLFSSILSVFFYGSTLGRLWRGVASVPLGPEALNGGTRTALIGVLIHICVAFTWSAVFLFLVLRSAWVWRLVRSPQGVIKVAAVYGPCIWLTMSLVVIPLVAGRPPAITYRWWIQLVGHIPFVGLPIVWSATRPPLPSRDTM